MKNEKRIMKEKRGFKSVLYVPSFVFRFLKEYIMIFYYKKEKYFRLDFSRNSLNYSDLKIK